MLSKLGHSCKFIINHISEADRSHAAQWFNFVFLSQVKGQHFHTTPTAHSVLLLNAPSFIVWTLKNGTRMQFSFFLQSQSFLTATGLQRSRYYANWIPGVKCKKHMEFHEYTEVIWTTGEICPGDPSRLVDSSSLNIVKWWPQKHPIISWFFFFFWSSVVDNGLPGKDLNGHGILQKETFLLAFLTYFTKLLT